MPQSLRYKISPLIPEEEINNRVHKLGLQLAQDYQDRYPLIIGVLKGSFVFLSDLIREMEIPLQVDFVRLSSYQDSTSPISTPELLLDFEIPAADRHIILVDDIIDTGHSIYTLRELVEKQSPASIRICALLDKPFRRVAPISIDYVGFVISDQFVAGYGIDVAEEYRYLRGIYTAESP